MSGDDPVHHENSTCAIVPPLPFLRFGEYTEFERAIYLGVGERLVASTPPTQAAESTYLRGQLLLEIKAEAIFVSSLAAGGNNVGHRRFTVLESANGFFVIAHVCVVQKNHQANRAGAVQEQASSSVEFKIFRARPAQVGIEENAIGNFRHKRFAKAYRKPMVVIFEYGRIRVTTRVCGVIVGPVVVHSPIQKLQTAVGAPGIGVEEIYQTHLAGAKFKPPRGERSSQTKRTALGRNALAAQRDNLPHHRAR